jgi:hypothetical protein
MQVFMRNMHITIGWFKPKNYRLTIFSWKPSIKFHEKFVLLFWSCYMRKDGKRLQGCERNHQRKLFSKKVWCLFSCRCVCKGETWPTGLVRPVSLHIISLDSSEGQTCKWIWKSQHFWRSSSILTSQLGFSFRRSVCTSNVSLLKTWMLCIAVYYHQFRWFRLISDFRLQQWAPGTLVHIFVDLPISRFHFREYVGLSSSPSSAQLIKSLSLPQKFAPLFSIHDCCPPTP